MKIEEGLPSAQEVLVWLADKNFDSLQETTIVCKWSAQQFGGLLSRLNACSQLQALAIGPPQSNPTEDSNGGLSPDLRSLCLSLANLKTLTFYCPFKWKPADITLRLPSLAVRYLLTVDSKNTLVVSIAFINLGTVASRACSGSSQLRNKVVRTCANIGTNGVDTSQVHSDRAALGTEPSPRVPPPINPFSIQCYKIALA